jgi:hypothetical protein
LKISAFLFAGLIFFVTFLHQGKKVKHPIPDGIQSQYNFTKKQEEYALINFKCEQSIPPH